MKKLFLMIVVTIISIQLGNAQQKKLSEEQLNDLIPFAAVNPLQKIFKETAFFEDIDAVADVTRYAIHISITLIITNYTNRFIDYPIEFV